MMRGMQQNLPRWGGLAAALLLSLVGCNDDTQQPTAPDATPELASASAATRSWLQLSAGPDDQSCGLTTDQRAYCWGSGYHGDGQAGYLSETPVAGAGGRQFRQISAGARHACGVTLQFKVYCWGD